jgi:outer membrane lipoprotein-sorting protein
MTFMVLKNPDGNDARWLYLPSVDLIKPISADDKNSSFFGSDFTYEDVSGRHWSEDHHTQRADSTIDDKDVYVIASVPVEPYKGFTRRVSYIDKATMLPLREDYFDKKDKLARRFLALEISEIDGIMTITRRSMENVKKGRKTSIEFTNISYNQGITADLFTERYLKNPPRKYFK